MVRSQECSSLATCDIGSKTSAVECFHWLHTQNNSSVPINHPGGCSTKNAHIAVMAMGNPADYPIPQKLGAGRIVHHTFGAREILFQMSSATKGPSQIPTVQRWADNWLKLSSIRPLACPYPQNPQVYNEIHPSLIKKVRFPHCQICNLLEACLSE